MVFCKKCGKVLDEGSTKCGYCGQEQNEDQQVINASASYSSYAPVSPALSNAKKVTLTAVTCLLSIVGNIIGLIVGIVYMGNDNTDTKAFGKALMILSVILLALSIICCILYFVVLGSVFASIFQEMPSVIDYETYGF